MSLDISDDELHGIDRSQVEYPPPLEEQAKRFGELRPEGQRLLARVRPDLVPPEFAHLIKETLASQRQATRADWLKLCQDFHVTRTW